MRSGRWRAVEGDPVEVAGVLAGLELGLRDRGLEGDVPQPRRLGLVGLAAGQVAQEAALRGRDRGRADGRVLLGPVDRQPQPAPQRLVGLLGLAGPALAELDEVAPRDRHLLLGVRLLRRAEVRVVGQRGVHAHAEVDLHPALGRQAVVVPAHRVEDLAAAHPLEPRDDVGVRVREDVADVQGAADGRRRGVDREDLLAGLGPVEEVGALLLPYLGPARPRARRRSACPAPAGRGSRRQPLRLRSSAVPWARILRSPATRFPPAIDHVWQVGEYFARRRHLAKYRYACHTWSTARGGAGLPRLRG